MRMTDIEIAYTVDLLSKLVESAEGYIDDGSWLEALTDDIKNAKQLVKKYNKRVKEIA
jgi:hypothetical protein